MINYSPDQEQFISTARKILGKNKQVPLPTGFTIQTSMSVNPDGLESLDLFQTDIVTREKQTPRYRIAIPQVPGLDHLAGDNWAETNISPAEALTYLE